MSEEVKALIKRVEIFIEDGVWDKAKEYCENILDKDPENPEAYKLALYVDFRSKNDEELIKNKLEAITSNNNYKRFMKYATEDMKTSFDVLKAKKEEVDKETDYQNALNYLEKKDEKNARALFTKLRNYKDSETKLIECDKLREELKIKSSKLKKKLLLVGIIPAILLIIGIGLLVYFNTVTGKFNIGLMQLKNGKYEEAIKSFEAAKKSDAKNDGYDAYIDYAVGLISLNKKEYKTAINKLKDVNILDGKTKYLEASFLNAEELWNDGYLRDAYDNMKTVYNIDSSFNLNGKSVISYLKDWVKQKDKINMLGSYKISTFDNFVYYADGSTNSINGNNKSSLILITFDSTYIVGNKIYYKLNYCIPFDLRNNRLDNDGLINAATNKINAMLGSENKKYEFSMDIGDTHFHDTINDGALSITINAFVSQNEFTFTFQDTTYIYGRLGSYMELVTMLKENNPIKDDISSFMTIDEMENGLNGNVYKKVDGTLAKDEYIKENGNLYYFDKNGNKKINCEINNFIADNNGILKIDENIYLNVFDGKKPIKCIVVGITTDKVIVICKDSCFELGPNNNIYINNNIVPTICTYISKEYGFSILVLKKSSIKNINYNVARLSDNNVDGKMIAEIDNKLEICLYDKIDNAITDENHNKIDCNCFIYDTNGRFLAISNINNFIGVNDLVNIVVNNSKKNKITFD